MVCENTGKLLGMPSQGGFFWRLTRRRVVKDWVLLARWGDAHGAPAGSVDLASGESHAITNEQRETFDCALAEASVLSDGEHGELRPAIVATLHQRLSNARMEQLNTSIRLITRRAFGFRSAEALIALAMLALGGLCPPLPGRDLT